MLDMADRYGLKKHPSRFIPILIFIVALVFLLWSALYHSNPGVRYSLISYKIIDSRNVEVRFDLYRKNANQSVTCTLTATDYDHLIVGEIQYRIPAGEKELGNVVKVPTRSAAFAASVSRCVAG